MRVFLMITTVAVTVVAVPLVGCGASNALTDSAAEHQPKLVTVVVADISGSTVGRRDAYLADAMTAVAATAELDGAVYVSTFDGLATDDVWQIPDQRFTTSIGGGNEVLARAARRQQAEQLRPRVERLLQGRGQAGTDLLVMLTNVRRLLCTLPHADRRVVIISDGAIVAGDVNLYRRPPQTQHARTQLIRHLRRSGEIPAELDCRTGPPVRVWLSGLGAGTQHRSVAIAVRRFFIQAVESTGAIVVAEGSQLLKRNFLSTEATSEAAKR